MRNSLFNPNNISNVIDNVLNSSLSDIIGTDFISDTPSVNITESEKQHNIILAVPGLSKSDFTITVEKDQLLVKGSQSKESDKEEQNDYIRREFSFTNFKRSFHLPETIDRENISASYENGILDITILKRKIEDAKQERNIDIV